jgi:hypothetical protein
MNTEETTFESCLPIEPPIGKFIMDQSDVNPEPITVEAMEKEPGWEDGTHWPGCPIRRFYSGMISVIIREGKPIDVLVENEDARGVSSMPDIRDLDRLLNGKSLNSK